MKKSLISFAAIAAVLLALPQTPYPCSSFAFPYKGCLVFGTNYDNSFWPGQLFINKRNVRKGGWEPGTTGRLATWTSRYGSVTIACAGYQLAWSGMNEAGLVVSTMSLEETSVPAPDERPSLTSALWVQYLFDTCATVEDVLQSEKDIRISDAGDHYLICDAKGDCAAVEFLEGKMVVHRGEGLTVRALTNLMYASCLEHHRSEAAPPGHRYHSFNRFARLADKLKNPPEAVSAHPLTAVDYAFDLLDGVRSETNTRWSLVFDTGAKVFYIKSFRNPRLRFIDLKRIDFACDKPALMLDAHADLSGDITAAFQDLSAEAIMAHFEVSLKHFRPDLPEEVWRPLVEAISRNYVCDEASDK